MAFKPTLTPVPEDLKSATRAQKNAFMACFPGATDFDLAEWYKGESNATNSGSGRCTPSPASIAAALPTVAPAQEGVWNTAGSVMSHVVRRDRAAAFDTADPTIPPQP